MACPIPGSRFASRATVSTATSLPTSTSKQLELRALTGYQHTTPEAYTSPFALRFGLIILMGLFSMGWYNLNRIAAEGGVPFMGVAFYQCLGGAAFMALLLIVRRKGIPVSRQHLVFYAVSGLFGAAIPNTSVAFASPHLPIGVLSMGLAIEPAVTYLVALPLLLEKFRTVRFFGILVGIAGLMLILLPQAALPSPDMVPWVILGLGAPIGWSLWNNYIAFARARDTPSKCRRPRRTSTWASARWFSASKASTSARRKR